MNEKPRILLYDLETSPYQIEAWGTYQTDALRIVRESYILCVAYKWLGEKTTHVVALPDFKKQYKKDRENDRELIKKLHGLFDEADIIIAHNGDKFDQKRSQGRFLRHKLPPPSPYRSIDTLKVARKYFALPSNRLDSLGEQLGLGRKVQHTGKKLWFDCMDGDMAAWKLMKKYNKQDVDLLEAVYLVMRPWIANHPNLSVWHGQDACPACDSTNLHFKGYRHTQTQTYKRFRCRDCGKWSHDKTRLGGAGNLR